MVKVIYGHFGYIGFAFLALTTQAVAGPDCTGWETLSAQTHLQIATVKTSKKLHFVRNSSEMANCPAASFDCQRKDYLVAGDRVIISTQSGGFVCGEYVGAHGQVSAGWLLKKTLKLDENKQTFGTSDWLGKWHGNVEQSIQIIRHGSAGAVSLHGDATFGALDPERIKLGGVNIGNFDADVFAKGEVIAFTADQGSGTLPYEKGDALSCQLRMRRLGEFLLVEDNHNCGGNNVSFTGNYRRR